MTTRFDAEMMVLDGTPEGWREALAAIAARPNPEHLREYADIEGETKSMADILAETAGNSRRVLYRTAGDAAMACGYGAGRGSYLPVWMTTTDAAEKRPRWLWRSSLECLDLLTRSAGPGVTFWQAIPKWYDRGLRFVGRLGFLRTARIASPKTGKPLWLVERKIWGS